MVQMTTGVLGELADAADGSGTRGMTFPGAVPKPINPARELP